MIRHGILPYATKQSSELLALFSFGFNSFNNMFAMVSQQVLKWTSRQNFQNVITLVIF